MSDARHTGKPAMEALLADALSQGAHNLAPALAETLRQNADLQQQITALRAEAATWRAAFELCIPSLFAAPQAGPDTRAAPSAVPGCECAHCRWGGGSCTGECLKQPPAGSQ